MCSPKGLGIYSGIFLGCCVLQPNQHDSECRVKGQTPSIHEQGQCGSKTIPNWQRQSQIKTIPNQKTYQKRSQLRRTKQKIRHPRPRRLVSHSIEDRSRRASVGLGGNIAVSLKEGVAVAAGDRWSGRRVRNSEEFNNQVPVGSPLGWER